MAFNTNVLGSCDGLFICIARWLNEITSNSFWTLFLVAFMVVLFMATFRFGSPRALAYSGMAGIFFSIMFLTLELMPLGTAIFFWIGGGIAIAAMVLGNRS